jgi:hypothetical protein
VLNRGSLVLGGWGERISPMAFPQEMGQKRAFAFLFLLHRSSDLRYFLSENLWSQVRILALGKKKLPAFWLRVFSWSAQSDAQRTYEQNSLYQILRNYRTFKKRLDGLQRILDNVVKPEGLELIKFTP